MHTKQRKLLYFLARVTLCLLIALGGWSLFVLLFDVSSNTAADPFLSREDFLTASNAYYLIKYFQDLLWYFTVFFALFSFVDTLFIKLKLLDRAPTPENFALGREEY